MSQKQTDKSSYKSEEKNPKSQHESFKSDPSGHRKGNDPKSKTSDVEKGQSSRNKPGASDRSGSQHK